MLARSSRHALRSGQTIQGLPPPCFYRTNTKSKSDIPRTRRREPREHGRVGPEDSHRRNSRTIRWSKSDGESTGERMRPKRYDAIPFERPPPRPDPYAELELEGSTITPNERKAFEGLFKLKQTSTRQQGSESQHRKEALKGLDAILDAAVDDIQPDGRRTSTFPAALRPIAEQARSEKEDQATEKSADGKIRKVERTEGADIQAAAKRELGLVSKAMATAKTDVEIWRILHQRVLNRVAALNLDSPQQQQPRKFTTTLKQNQEPPFNAPIPPQPHLILAQTLPSHLRSTMTHLRSFPSSPLPLTLLPTLSSLGPSAFALGASTGLYNMHIAYLFRRYADLHGICDVLREMDKLVFEFDEGTLGVLVGVLRYAAAVERGLEGEGVKMFWESEVMRKGLDGIFRWKSVVQERVEERAVRLAREREEEEFNEVG